MKTILFFTILAGPAYALTAPATAARRIECKSISGFCGDYSPNEKLPVKRVENTIGKRSHLSRQLGGLIGAIAEAGVELGFAGSDLLAELGPPGEAAAGVIVDGADTADNAVGLVDGLLGSLNGDSD